MATTNDSNKLSESDERNFTSLGNLLGLIGSFLPSLIVWLIYKDRSAFVDRNMKSALNFQLTMILGYVIGGVLTIVIIGSVIILAVWILTIIFSIMGFAKTRSGEDYSYPLTIKFLK